MPFTEKLYQCLSQYFMKDVAAPRTYLSDFDQACHELRPADVLLVEGRNRISKIIKHVTFSPWSHAALYIGKLHDITDPHIRERVQQYYKGAPTEHLIIETIVGKGTLIRPLSVYRDEHLRICRPSGLLPADVQHVIARTTESLGGRYNTRQFFDLGRLLLRSKFILPRFRSSLFNYKTGKAAEDICSTMIANAFMSVKFPVLPLVRKDDQRCYELIPRNPQLFTPSDFDYSPYFDIIKYPIFNIAQPTHYRNLPWNEGYYSNDEYGVSQKK